MSEYLICYDISCPKRLARLHRMLKKCAVPIQYSVFMFMGDERQLQRCLDQAAAIIDPLADDLRAYPLPKRGLRLRLGKPTLPEGIQLSCLPQML